MNLRWTLSLVSFVALYGSVARADELECGAAPPNVDLAALPPAQKTEVDERFRRGVEFYQAGDYKLALIEFERVYQIAPSYKYLYNIGQVNLQLNNYARAQIALRDYLCGGGSEIAEARRAEVLGDLEGLRKRTAHISLVLQSVERGAVTPLAIGGAQITIDDLPLAEDAAAQPILVDAGMHRIGVRRSGYRDAQAVVTLAGADERSVTIKLEKIEEPKVVMTPPSSGISPVVIAGWGTTAALGIGWGVTGLLALSAASDLSQLRDDKTSRSSVREGTANRLKTFALASDILGGATLVAGGVSLYFTLRPSKSKSPAEKRKGAEVSFGVGSVHLRGTF